jgi:sterol desaturase/sphingolipid hydroxylase (fatty acid hydroxylase superfamily)
VFDGVLEVDAAQRRHDVPIVAALRFHPLEIVLSMLIKVVAVIALGADAIAVIMFEVILNACAMFNHANLRLPIALDHHLRCLLVTPDMHRVHHSTRADEHHSNFGFNLSIWDRLARTYRDQPRDGHAGMRIGLPAFQTAAPNSLLWCLRLPFSRDGSPDGR